MVSKQPDGSFRRGLTLKEAQGVGGATGFDGF